MKHLLIFATLAFVIIASVTDSFGQRTQRTHRASETVKKPTQPSTTQPPAAQPRVVQLPAAQTPTSTTQPSGIVRPQTISLGATTNRAAAISTKDVRIPNIGNFISIKQPDSHTCGPTSAVMLANYYGKDVSIATMKDKAKTSSFAVRFPGTELNIGSISASKAGYTDPDHLVWAINDYVPTIMKEGASEQDIADAIKKGKPVITLIAGDEFNLIGGNVVGISFYGMHYFCIVGYVVNSEGQVTEWIISDTNGKETYKMERRKFQRAWNFDDVGSKTKSVLSSAGVVPRTILIPTRPAYIRDNSKYVPGGKGKNARIKLHELRCIKQEDNTGSDDIVVRSHLSSEKIEGFIIKTVEDYNNKFWRGPMSRGNVRDLSKAPEHKLRADNTGFIALTEIDDVDPNDQLGTCNVNANETNGGVMVVKFTGHATQYLLAYEIIGEKADPVLQTVAGIVVSSRTQGTAIEAQNMMNYQSGSWTNGDQLFWAPKAVNDRLDVLVNVPAAGRFQLYAKLTKASDFGIFSFQQGSNRIGQQDLYASSVTSTQLVPIGTFTANGSARCTITVQLVGKNAQSKGYKFGMDTIEARPVSQ